MRIKSLMENSGKSAGASVHPPIFGVCSENGPPFRSWLENGADAAAGLKKPAPPPTNPTFRNGPFSFSYGRDGPGAFAGGSIFEKSVRVEFGSNRRPRFGFGGPGQTSKPLSHNLIARFLSIPQRFRARGFPVRRGRGPFREIFRPRPDNLLEWSGPFP